MLYYQMSRILCTETGETNPTPALSTSALKYCVQSYRVTRQNGKNLLLA